MSPSLPVLGPVSAPSAVPGAPVSLLQGKNLVSDRGTEQQRQESAGPGGYQDRNRF